MKQLITVSTKGPQHSTATGREAFLEYYKTSNSLFTCNQHNWGKTVKAAYGLAPPSMGFSRQEYWSGLPFPPPGDLPNSSFEPTSLMSPALAGRFFPTGPPGSPFYRLCMCNKNSMFLLLSGLKHFSNTSLAFTVA